MSTNERYGTIVWNAVCALAREYSPVVMMGEVAKAAQVSLPTAKKYLDKLHDLGHVERHITSSGIRVYIVRLQYCEDISQ